MSEFSYMMVTGEPLPCRCSKAGKEGLYYGKFNLGDGSWCIVQWSDEDDPDFIRVEYLEVGIMKWESLPSI